MKKTALLIFCLAAVCAQAGTQAGAQTLSRMPAVAPVQNTVMTGSLQVIYPGREQVEVELAGIQVFSERITGDLLISNLIPGEYMLRIYLRQGRYGVAEYYNGRVTVRQSQRTVISLNNPRLPSVAYANDRNSIALNLDAGRYPDRGGRDDRNLNPYDDRSRNPYAEPVGYDRIMTDAEFSRFITEVRNASFDDAKLNVIGIAARYNMFTTAQVASVLNCFSFDESKLKCVDMLRGRIVDMRNAHSLASCFAFKSSRDRFYEMLR